MAGLGVAAPVRFDAEASGAATPPPMSACCGAAQTPTHILVLLGHLTI